MFGRNKNREDGNSRGRKNYGGRNREKEFDEKMKEKRKTLQIVSGRKMRDRFAWIQKGVFWHGVLFSVVITLCCAALYFFLRESGINEYRGLYLKYKTGMISDDTVYLREDLDIVDEDATKASREYAARAVSPVFAFRAEVTMKVLSRMADFVDALRHDDGDRIGEGNLRYFYGYIKENNGERAVSLAYQVIEEIMKQGLFRDNEIQELKGAGTRNIVTVNNYLDDFFEERKIRLEDGLLTDADLTGVVAKILSNYGADIELSERYIVLGLARNICEANVFYDSAQTDSRRLAAYNNAGSVVVSLKAGRPILQIDTVITERQMANLALLSGRTRVDGRDIMSVILFNLACSIIIYYIMYHIVGSDGRHFNTYLYTMLFYTACTTVTAYFLVHAAAGLKVEFLPSFIPICFLPMHMTMMSGRRTMGSISAFVMGLVSLSIPSSTYYSFFYGVMLGVVSSFVVRFFNRRIDQILQALVTVLVSIAITLLFVVIVPNQLKMEDFIYSAVVKALLGLSSSVLLMFLIPVEERLFNLPTTFRLYELFYGESDLMDRLAKVAPGTYTHSRAVADLAFSGANAIGANAGLARVAALYHDIGKLEHPNYFTENQYAGENRLIDLNPGQSVSIIRRHVSYGAELARENGLPEEIVEIIHDHHGTDVIQYFYNKAREMKDENLLNEIAIGDYSYNNAHKPSTRECGLIMLADSVEAASRSVKEPNVSKFTKLIDSIVSQKIERGQLDKCPLSMKEISTLKESFLHSLMSIHHVRISYNTKEGGKDKGSEEK